MYCKHYQKTDAARYMDFGLAKMACTEDMNCRAIVLLNCNSRKISGFCNEANIAKLPHGNIKENCIYKKGIMLININSNMTVNF